MIFTLMPPLLFTIALGAMILFSNKNNKDK